MPVERSRSAKLLSWRAPTKGDGSPVKIGVGITTHNRPEITAESLKHWRAHLPKGAVLVVVDDASETPFPEADYRFEQNVGVAQAKNKCFELLEDLDVDEFFLADDDCYPKSMDWWQPYVNSPEPHLSYQYLDLVGPVKLHDMAVLFRDSEHTAYDGQRGCLLYYSNDVLRTVGGFDTSYGGRGSAHVDLADRIHAAGLTTWRYADVSGSHKIWHSMDEYASVPRAAMTEKLSQVLAADEKRLTVRRETQYQGFAPYRSDIDFATQDIVLGCYFTGGPTVQGWGGRVSITPRVTPKVQRWLEVMEVGAWDSVILSDELKSLPNGYSSALVSSSCIQGSPVCHRWTRVYQYLRVHPEVRWVWCADIETGILPQNLFDDLAVGRLYVCSSKEAIDAEKVINPSVVGGDRQTVMEFAQKIVTLFNDYPSDKSDGVFEFNRAVYQFYTNKIAVRANR